MEAASAGFLPVHGSQQARFAASLTFRFLPVEGASLGADAERSIDVRIEPAVVQLVFGEVEVVKILDEFRVAGLVPEIHRRKDHP